MIWAPQSAQNFIPTSKGAPHSGQFAGEGVSLQVVVRSLSVAVVGFVVPGCTGAVCCGGCGGILLGVV